MPSMFKNATKEEEGLLAIKIQAVKKETAKWSRDNLIKEIARLRRATERRNLAEVKRNNSWP